MSYYEENKKKVSDLDAIKAWLLKGNKNEFVESVYSQSLKRLLSHGQVEALSEAVNG